jgi:hypothetical protein
MPTTFKRHMITETPDVTVALEAARAAWPGETSVARLLTRLALVGASALPAPDEARETRRQRFAARAGRYQHRLTGAEFAALREEWPG